MPGQHMSIHKVEDFVYPVLPVAQESTVLSNGACTALVFGPVPSANRN